MNKVPIYEKVNTYVKNKKNRNKEIINNYKRVHVKDQYTEADYLQKCLYEREIYKNYFEELEIEYEVLNDLYLKLAQECDDYKAKNSIYQHKVDNLQLEISKYTSIIEANNNYEAEIQRLNGEIEKYKGKWNSTKKTLNSLKKEQESPVKEEGLEEKNEELKKSLDNLNNELSKLRRQSDTYSKDYRKSKKEMEELRKQKEDKDKENEETIEK